MLLNAVNNRTMEKEAALLFGRPRGMKPRDSYPERDELLRIRVRFYTFQKIVVDDSVQVKKVVEGFEVQKTSIRWFRRRISEA